MAIASEAVEAQAAAADADLAPADSPTVPASPAPADTPAVDGTPTPDAETPPASDVPVRDAQGRFTADAPEQEPGPPETPETEPDLNAYPPFSFRADGQEHPYPGAVQDDDGNVLFTPAAVAQLKHDLAYARAYPRRDAEAQRDLSRERKAREAAEATAEHLLATFDDLVDKSHNASTVEELIQTPLGQWLTGLVRNWPSLRAEAQQKGFELRAKAQDEELATLRRQQEDAHQRPVMVGLIEEAVEHYGTQAGLKPNEKAELIREFSADDMLDRVFPRAQQDDPVNGITAGQRIDDRPGYLRREILRMHRLLQNRTPAQRVAAVQQENAKRLGQTGTKPPPMAGVGRGKPAGTKPKPYTSTREADDDIWG